MIERSKEWWVSRAKNEANVTIGAGVSEVDKQELSNLLISRVLMTESELKDVPTTEDAHEMVAAKMSEVLATHNGIHALIDAIARKNGVGIMERSAYASELLERALQHHARLINKE